MEYKDYIDFHEFIKLMQLKSFLRTDCEKKMILNYLKENKFLDLLQKCKIPDIEISKICKIFGDNAEKIDLVEGEILFRIGNPGDKFYLILSGDCQVLKPIRKKAFLTPKDFLKFLYKLKKEKETYLL